MSPDDDPAQAVLWMLAQLDPATQGRVRRRLALRLDRPISPTERRRRDLSFVSELLRPLAPRDGWSFAYIPRTQYESERPADAPSSTVLVDRYGSWVEVCRHAYALATLGRLLPGPPHRRPRDGTWRRYRREDVVGALRECADEINRAPSRNAYSLWRLAAEHRRPTRHYPSESVVTRLYAERGGWRAALEDAALMQPPALTVRAGAPTAAAAAEITEAVRAAGLVAAIHPQARRCVEIRGTLVTVKRALSKSRTMHTRVTLWETDSQTLEAWKPRCAQAGSTESPWHS